MRHGSLFSGIGGFDLAARWMGWENVFQVEIDPFCQNVLEKNFPSTKRYGDIKEFDGTKYRRSIDILTGGFPCQPFSHAGKRKGKNDERFLWPEMLRIIGEIRPKFIVGENVGGSRKLVDEICSGLEDRGYETKPTVIEAGAVGANIIRERFWFISSPKGNGNNQWEKPHRRKESPIGTDIVRECNGGNGTSNKEHFESGVCRIIDGIPQRMDRLKAIGNAIVPQIAYEIFKAIEMTLVEK